MMARWQGAIAILAFAAVLPAAHARKLIYHGPLLVWHRDPATSVTFAWVEEIAPDASPPPVWRTGPAGFGYGDGDDRTELTDMANRYKRVYLAKSFHLDSVAKDATVNLIIRYDDAFVAWINGVEIARSANLEGQHTTGNVTKGHEARESEVFTIRNAGYVLEKGENLLTIEGHNLRASSSDLTIDPILAVNGVTVVPEGAEWKYLAGIDPPARWFLRAPAVSEAPEVPRAEKSEWTLALRRRGSGAPFEAVKIDEREFGQTGNPLFEAQVKDLRPGTGYDYVLAADRQPVDTGWFLTAPAVLLSPVSFVAGGDMGTSTAIPICKRAGREDPLFAVVGGDLAYAGGREAYKWYDWLDNWKEFVVGRDGRAIPIIAAIGNHEVRLFRGKKSDAPFYYSLFDLPKGDSNFSVDFGAYMSIVVLDSNHTQKVENQTDWLERTLADRQGVEHLFVIYHRPAWGTGVKLNEKEIQREWCPLFEKYGVDCVFENDHHVYKRTHKIVHGWPDDQNGVLYIGDGAWGAALRPITEQTLERVNARQYLARWASRHHLVKVTAFPGGMKKYEATAADGEVFDEFADRGTPPTLAGREDAPSPTEGGKPRSFEKPR